MVTKCLSNGWECVDESLAAHKIRGHALKWSPVFPRGLEKADDHWVASCLKAYTLTACRNMEL